MATAAGFYLLAHFFGGKGPDRSVIKDDAEKRAADIKAAADAQLQAELQEVDADREELDRIKGISDDEARLQALADYANKRRR